MLWHLATNWLIGHWLIGAGVACAVLACTPAGWAVLKLIVGTQTGRVACLLAIALGAVNWYGSTRYAAGVEDQRVATDAANARADAAQAAESKTRDRYMGGVDAAYQRGLKDAQAVRDGVAADLRAGNLRLSRLWRGCEVRAAADVPAPETAGSADADAALRAASAGRVIGAGHEADQQVRCLQAVALIDRGINPGDLSKGCPTP